MGYTQWILVQDADSAFSSVPYPKYSAFHDGKAVLPQVGPREVRLVELIVVLENRVATSVRSIQCRRYPVQPDGVRDRVAADRELALRLNLPSGGPQRGVDSAMARFTKRQLDVEFHWEPTESEAQAIADAVNRRARRALLGRHPIRVLD